MKKGARITQSVQQLTTGWTAPGLNPGGAREFLFFTPIHTGPGTHTAYCTMGTNALSWRSNSWGMALTTNPHLVSRLRMSRALLLLSPLPSWHVMFYIPQYLHGKLHFTFPSACTACYVLLSQGLHCLVWGHLYLSLY